MASIRVISTSTIQATNHDDNSTPKMIHLNPWDLAHLQTQAIQQGLLFHKPKTNQIQHLKQTLSSTLNFFPPLVGRLLITQYPDDHVSFSITCNNAGALFIHATAENTTIADILQPKYVPPVVQSFFPFDGVKNCKGTSHPLLVVQVTELVDGIFIGININHVVVDAKSFWFFVNSWAEASNGFNKLTEMPSFDRWFPNHNDRPIKFPFTKELQNQIIHFPEEVQNQQCEDSRSLIQIIHFTKEQILQLKSKANAEIDNSNNNNIVISSLQAVVAHLWRLIMSKRDLEPEENTYCMIPMDCRARVFPKLPDTYFGNGTGALAFVIMKVGKLVEGGFGRVAMEINKVLFVESLHEKIMSYYESWFRLIGQAPSTMLIVANSPRLNFYGNDFGWGKPIAIRNGNGLAYKTNNITVLGGSEEGSFDVELCLPYHIFEAMENEMHAVTA